MKPKTLRDGEVIDVSGSSRSLSRTVREIPNEIVSISIERTMRTRGQKYVDCTSSTSVAINLPLFFLKPYMKLLLMYR